MEMVIYFVVIAAMCALVIYPQKKRQKETEQMINNIKVGDRITTIGGITGIVYSLSGEGENGIVFLQTGDSHIELKRWAIRSKDTLLAVSDDDGEKNRKKKNKDKDKKAEAEAIER